MKRIFLATVVALMLLGINCFAAQNPTVTLNGSEIIFADQTAIIKDDRTLVPARGVFEAMGAKVQWDGEVQRVQIDSGDNLTRVFMTIGEPSLRIYKFKDLYSADRYATKIDVAPQIINDRTMIPLRAVSEAFDCKVDWDETTRTVIITTKDGVPEISDNNDTPYIYLTTEADDVKKDEEFIVYANMKNFNSQYALTSGSVAINYDESKFEVVSSEMCVDGFMYAANPEFRENVFVCAFATGGYSCKAKDEAYVKVTFKALSDDGGEISISTMYETVRGYMTSIGLSDPKTHNNYSYTPLSMGIDTTPIVLK